MYNENLSLHEAIEKLKYELCGLKKNNSNQAKTLEYFSAKELKNMDLQPVQFFVYGMLPQGLTLLCGVPKIGKSWLLLDLVVDLAKGINFLGFETKKVSCLYLALEDSKNRLYDRLSKILNKEEFPDNLYFAIQCGNIEHGLIEQLYNIIEEHPDIKIIAIDTLQKVRSDSKGNNYYASDYKELSKLKKFADDNSIAIILVHHLNKSFETSDVFSRVSGTTGITGTADNTMVLYKENRNDTETTLSIIGRDVEQNDYILQFLKDSCKFKLLSSMEEYNNYKEKLEFEKNTLVKTIIKIVEENNGVWCGIMKELNEKHLALFGKYYADSPIKLKFDVRNLAPTLKKYANIQYIEAEKNPTAKGRIITLRKYE